MNGFENENILKLVFYNFPLFKNKQLFDLITNKLVNSIILRILNYKAIFKSMGKSNNIIIDGWDNLIDVLPNNNILSLLNGKTLKEWDINKYTCIKSKPAEYPISSFIIHPDGNIIICSFNGIIKVFNPKNNFKCIKTVNLQDQATFLQRAYGFENLHLRLDDIICSVESMNLIVVLDYCNEFEYKGILLTGVNNIQSLAFISWNKIACVSKYTDCFKIWGLLQNECLAILEHRYYVTTLLFIDVSNLLLSGSRDKTIKVWDMNDYQCIKTIEVDTVVNCFLLLPNGYFVSAGDDEKIKIWDLYDYRCFNVLSLDVEPFHITSLKLLKDYRIACSFSKGIIIFDN
jgi:WD40 repeat protein